MKNVKALKNRSFDMIHWSIC